MQHNIIHVVPFVTCTVLRFIVIWLASVKSLIAVQLEIPGLDTTAEEFLYRLLSRLFVSIFNTRICTLSMLGGNGKNGLDHIHA